MDNDNGKSGKSAAGRFGAISGIAGMLRSVWKVVNRQPDDYQRHVTKNRGMKH
jgi:hypothetical protein